VARWAVLGVLPVEHENLWSLPSVAQVVRWSLYAPLFGETEGPSRHDEDLPGFFPGSGGGSKGVIWEVVKG